MAAPSLLEADAMSSSTGTFTAQGVRVAVEGCGHGTLNAIYACVKRAASERGWDGVDLVIIGGDFQAARNEADLSVMSVPAKYRALGDFYEYYSGERTAPYLTIFVGGNHEAASHLWELYYGGWVATNIYYMGAANVLRLGPLRIAGMSGIWKHFDYRKTHFERLPFSHDYIKSCYHVREYDVRKLLQVRTQVDIGISHDWPRGIWDHGDLDELLRMKPHFREDCTTGKLGSPAVQYAMDRLRPAYWFAAHLHCKFAAIKQYPPPGTQDEEPTTSGTEIEATVNPDEIDLDMDEEDDVDESRPAEAAPEAVAEQEPVATTVVNKNLDAATENPDEIDLDSDDGGGAIATEPRAKEPQSNGKSPSTGSAVPEGLPPRPPPSFSQSAATENTRARRQPNYSDDWVQPGQPVPPGIANTTVRFLALDKCLPGRKFLQLLDATPVDPTETASHPPRSAASALGGGSDGAVTAPRYRLEYDPEWLAITRVFAKGLAIGSGDKDAQSPADLGQEAYRPLIEAERAWIDEHVVRKGRLHVPDNFALTAPPHFPSTTMPQTTPMPAQPAEYTNPQTTAFCELVGVENLWDASDEERAERKRRGPPRNRSPPPRPGWGGGGGPSGFASGSGWNGDGGGRGRGRGGGDDGHRGGRGRGGRGGGRGRGGGGRGRAGFGGRGLWVP